MNKDYIMYASRLDKLEDLIISASNLKPVLDPGHKYILSELDNYKEELTVVSERYQFIINELKNGDVPEVVVEEHERLIEGITLFVRGAILIKDSMNVEERSILCKQCAQGDSILGIGVKQVEKAIKEIGDKLVGLIEQ
ncbi:hypothetical protein [Metabacillus fastidiosus]|uniref:hypothetical protein n=1 Tax=Metabacillus fastidiosus TaxID=1458 RepID=UPI002DBCA216|nr:hypothetical protein [Metabacillus fastidiosus]MEC2074573.1 hypothetical protein [Metabacillus fastidiosus]